MRPPAAAAASLLLALAAAAGAPPPPAAAAAALGGGGGGGCRAPSPLAVAAPADLWAPVPSPPASAAAANANASSFVAVSGLRFVVGCSEWPAMGFNSYALLEAAAGCDCGSWGADYSGPAGPAAVGQVLAGAAAAGLTYARAWAFSVDRDAPMQLSPGVFDANLLVGLDRLVAAARAARLRLSLVLSNWWDNGGEGAAQLVAWAAPPGAPKTAFYTDDAVARLYQATVLALLTRVNSVTGVAYRDDPTIFAWELINEPQCYGCPGALQAWTERMSAFVALHAPRQLRTLGSEGFYPPGGGPNPAPWAALSGQDFVANHGGRNVSFAATHLWPANWARGTVFPPNPIALAAQWLRAHAAAAAGLGKPLLLNEFGFSRAPVAPWSGATTRDAFYAAVYAEVRRSLAAGGALRGAAFWALYPTATFADTSRDPFAVYLDERVVARQAAAAAADAADAAAAAAGSLCVA